MKELSIGPGEYLFKAGEFDDRLYILVSGQIDLHFERPSSQEQSLYTVQKNNEIFGIQEFLSQQPRSCSAKSLELTNIMYCKREDFLQVAKTYARDLVKFISLIHQEKFHEMKDYILLYGASDGTACYSCGRFSHNVYECPKVHFLAE